MSHGDRKPTKGEVIANVVTHAVGSLLAIAGLVLLVVFSSCHGTARHIVSCSIYGATLWLMFIMSTVYHSLPDGAAKKVLRIFDHCAIYLVIAGTYTPFTLAVLPPGWGWSIFGVIWGLAILGIIQKIFFINRWPLLSTILYILMGWIIVIASKPMFAILPPGGIAFLVAGGVAYTFGALFYVFDNKPYLHAVWHIFVLAGAICQYMSIFFFVIP
ncbi:hemolysin III family protein [bacterium]|nr:hemolysin III family protein [bacterium]